MNKIDEIKVAIEETIKPNNKKAINAQTLANILNAMADVMPESGGGLKYSEERMLYLSDNEGFNEEQRTYNIETYNKAVSGEAITVNMGGAILAISPTGVIDEQGNEIVETTAATISQITAWVQLFSDGSTLSQAGTTSGSNLLIYDDQESFKQFFAKPTFYLEDAAILLIVGLLKVTGITIPIESTPSATRVTMSCVGMGMAMDLVCDVNTGEILEEHSYSIKASNKVYLNVNDTESVYTEYNREAVVDGSEYDTFVAVDATGDTSTRYMVLSISYNISYAIITIYRNDKFEKWQINRTDGTSSLITQ